MSKAVVECRDGWVVLQKRTSNSVTFWKNWADYKSGFGDSANTWLGNDNLHQLTRAGFTELRIELMEADGNTGYGEWDGFGIADEANKYRLSVGKMIGGTIGDNIFYMNGASFTTKDSDNDSYADNCAELNKGGWWYTNCHEANLNGYYGPSNNGKAGVSGCKSTCIHYKSWAGTGNYRHDKSLKESYMMIRRGHGNHNIHL